MHLIAYLLGTSALSDPLQPLPSWMRLHWSRSVLDGRWPNLLLLRLLLGGSSPVRHPSPLLTEGHPTEWRTCTVDKSSPNRSPLLTVHYCVQCVTHFVFWSDITGGFFAWALTMEHPLEQARKSSMFWPTTLRRPPKQSAKDSGICKYAETYPSLLKLKWITLQICTFSALSI